jgi:uncharacterized membrane protein YedE/YeeE
MINLYIIKSLKDQKELLLYILSPFGLSNFLLYQRPKGTFIIYIIPFWSFKLFMISKDQKELLLYILSPFGLSNFLLYLLNWNPMTN